MALPGSESPASDALGTVLVTGGSSGLGRAVVEAVGAAGGTPVVLDRADPPPGYEGMIVDLADGRAAEAAVHRIAGTPVSRSPSPSGRSTTAVGEVLERPRCRGPRRACEPWGAAGSFTHQRWSPSPRRC